MTQLEAPPEAEKPVAGGSRVSPRTVVVGLAAASAVAAVVLSALVFPRLSVNNDEPIYRLHAEAVANGHLFPPAPAGLAAQFRPWLAAIDGGHYVLKYNPAVPALLAVSLLLTGGSWLFLAATAGGAVAMTWFLAREVLGDGWDAVVAAGVVALSPLFIVQGALLLPYVTTFVLLELFCWALLRAARTARPRLLVVAGLALGTAFVIRPFDAVLFGPLMLVWVVLVARPAWSWARAVASLAVPAAVAASWFFVYNAMATGDPLRPSFSLLQPQDTLGFGIRRLYPSDPPHSFGLAQGVEGLVRHGALLDTWLAGGVVLLALAAVTLLRRRGGSAGPWLAASAGIFLAGYVFFWGPWNATVLWGGTAWFGPFYFLPVCIPVAILGARGLCDLARVRPPIAVLAAAAMVVLSVPTMVRAVADNLDLDRQTATLAGLVDHGPSPRLVVAEMPTPFLLHPSAVVGNNWDLTGSTLYSIADPARDLEVAAAFPSRTPYRLVFDDDFKDPGARPSGRFEQLHLVRGATVALDVVARAGGRGGQVEVVVDAGGVRRTFVLADAAAPRQPFTARVVVDSSGATVPDRAPVAEEPVAASGGVAFEVRQEGRVAGAQTVASRSVGGVVTVLAPAGPSWTAGPATPPALEVRG